MDADLVLKTVQTCLQIMESRPSCLMDSTTLPFSRETAKRAIQMVWFATDDEETRRKLKDAYIRLADFQIGVDGASGKTSLEKRRLDDKQALEKDVELWERDEFE